MILYQGASEGSTGSGSGFKASQKTGQRLLSLILHNQGLRLALGAFRTSPVASLYVEADEPSLYSRREKLSLQYAIRLAANPSNPAHEVTFPSNYVDLYEKKNLKLLNHLASEFHHS